jgi:7,8-dihydropterin-6-yl-methyl-4-(beta-D-ribofuranosyl)aminobenzene 5'-phosphate synthase
MSMVIEAKEGLILVCGCCHAGLLNTMAHVRRVFHHPITVVMGGSHLVSADDDYLQHVIDVLRKDYHPVRFYLNHCTGERAIIALSNAFGELVQPFPVGSQLVFD